MSTFTFKVVDKPTPFTELVQAINDLSSTQRIEVTLERPKDFHAFRITLSKKLPGQVSTMKLDDTTIAIERKNGKKEK